MKPKYHGIRYDEGKGTWAFHFSIIRLLWLFADDKRFAWSDKWSDNKSNQAITAFQNTFNKFDRAAEQFDRRAEIIKQHHDVSDPLSFSKFDSAIRDMPLYLDSMLTYLRIQAECLGDLIPYFYGQQGKKESMPRDGFRKHLDWFTEKRVSYDPRYKEILLAHQDWFMKLGGEGRGKGLRNIIMHQRGTYQISRISSDDPNDFELQVSLISDSGIVHDNVLPELKEIVLGYFLYLDEAFIHFTELIGANLPGGSIPIINLTKGYRSYLGSPIPSVWVYPVIEE